MGGETGDVRRERDGQYGLSPRGRGNHHLAAPAIHVHGSIPAWAGKPTGLSGGSRLEKVYPRVGGETCLSGFHSRRIYGLSPRGRGNPLAIALMRRASRSIPAWAGKPSRGRGCRRASMVYPRVGGETCVDKRIDSRNSGLSPRGRGNQAVLLFSVLLLGSIPAWAGKPLCHNDPVSQEMNMSKINVSTETHLPSGESDATRAGRQVALDGAEL